MNDHHDCVNNDASDDFDTDRHVASAPVARTPGRKIPPLVGHALADLGVDEFDFVFAQRPQRPRDSSLLPERFPGKRFAIGADGRKEKRPYNLSGWFRTWCYAVSDIGSLHAAFERVRTCADTNGEPGYVVAGDLADAASPLAAPRSKHASVSASGRVKPRGLVDARRSWLVLDMDKIPNPVGLDPRVDDASRLAVIGYMRGLLPDEMRYAACSWQLSSSCGVFRPEGLPLPAGQPPARLGAHLRFWLDTGLDEGQRRLLLQRLSHYVRLQLESRGLEPLAGAGVDPATATYNQAIFLCASFESGLQDPLPVRSGLMHGTPEVLVGILEEQMPTLPVAVKAVRKPLTDDEKKIGADRRAHDRLLRDATRGHAPAPRPRPAAEIADPVPGVRLNRRPRSQGPQHRVLHVSRVGKLHDIVALTDDRRTRLADWRGGLPVGMRRKTMLLVAGLLSHLVPVTDLPDAIHEYGEHLTSGDWLSTEWHATRQSVNIIRRAELAEGAERAGIDGSPMREDPWLERIMNCMQPTYDEMIRLRLRALRTDAARKEIKRRDNGKPTVEERRELQATSSEAARRPWEAHGISEATYRRRKRTTRLQAAADAVDITKARLTARGLQDVLAYMRQVAAPWVEDSLQTLADGPMSAISHEIARDGMKVFIDRWSYPGTSYRGARIRHIASTLYILHDAGSTEEPSSDVLQFILVGMPKYLAWAHEHDTGERLHAVSDLMSLAQSNPRPRAFIAAVADRETPVTVLASVYQVMNDEVTGGGQTPWPGVDAAGCSRATWFRRQAGKKPRPVPVEADVEVTPAANVIPALPQKPLAGDWTDHVPW